MTERPVPSPKTASPPISRFDRVMGEMRILHARRADAPLPDDWKDGVMLRVRRSVAARKEADQWPFLGWLAWRFVGAAAAVVLVLSILTYQAGTAPEAQLSQLFLDNPVEYGLVETMEVM